MAILVEAPHTVHATANETGALPATLPKVLRPTIFTIADIKGWNFNRASIAKMYIFTAFGCARTPYAAVGRKKERR